MSIGYSYSDIAKMIDHSLLNPALMVPELEAGCQLALRYDVASVCILPYYAARCAALLSRRHGANEHHDRLSSRGAYHGRQTR